MTYREIIEQLRTDSQTAGDWGLAHLCDLALNDSDPWTPAPHEHTRVQALAELAERFPDNPVTTAATLALSCDVDDVLRTPIPQAP